MPKRVMGFLDKLLQAPGAYASTYGLLQSYAIPSLFLTVLVGMGGWFAKNIEALNEMGWGVYPFVGLLLAAIVVAVFWCIAALYFYIWPRKVATAAHEEVGDNPEAVTFALIDRDETGFGNISSVDRRQGGNADHRLWMVRIENRTAQALSGLRLKAEARCFRRPWLAREAAISPTQIALPETSLNPSEALDVVIMSNRQQGPAWIGDYLRQQEDTLVQLKDGRFYSIKLTLTSSELPPQSVQLLARNNNIEAKIFDVFGHDEAMKMAYENVPTVRIDRS